MTKKKYKIKPGKKNLDYKTIKFYRRNKQIKYNINTHIRYFTHDTPFI